MQELFFFSVGKIKSFNKVYSDRSVNLGNQELSVVYLSICALLLIYAGVIFNGIVNNFYKNFFEKIVPFHFKC